MKLILIDGYGFVFRAYHSLPPLTSPQGLPVGAIYGFTNMLYKFLNAHSCDYIAVVLDSGGKNFRHELYTQYKANRPPAPEDLLPQFPIIRDVIEAFNLKALESAGLEADDLIASYAQKAAQSDMEVVIVSSDKDLMQLISDNISLYDPMRDRKISYEQVQEKFGVNPDKVGDILALMGDSSDNIPGVRGIGPKTAAELINQFGTLDGIYANLDQIPQAKRKQMLIEDKENAYLSKQLISLKTTTDIDLEDLRVKDIDKEKLSDFLKKFGFKALASKVAESNLKEPHHVANNIDFAKTNYKELKAADELNAYISGIEHAGEMSIHLHLDTLQISAQEHLQIKFSEKQGDMFQSDIPTLEAILNVLKPLFENPGISKYLADAKAFYKTLKRLGIILNNCNDPLVIAYSIDTAINGGSIQDVLKQYLDTATINSASILELGKVLNIKLVENKASTIYQKIEKPLLPVLADMELKGVKIDAQKLADLSREFNNKASILEAKIFELAGLKFNIGSPKQLAEVLFEKLGLKVENGKKKQKSTGVEVLEELAKQGVEIAEFILKWRQYTKLVNTYTEPLPRAIDPKTQRIHTTFTTTITTTGRLSSISPNLQNIPIRSEEGQKIREAFVVEPGNLMISADYSQIELRLLAEIAGIEKLKKAFAAGLDIHKATASEMFGVPLSEVDSELRRKAKTINFGIIYGISAFGLAERLGITREHAKEFIDNYFEKYPEIKEYMSKTIEFARSNGYIKTLYNRKCVVNSINDKNYFTRSFAERAAINAPLQGTASDIIKLAMNNMPEAIRRYMILQIHDELLFEVPEAQAPNIAAQVKQVMESVCHFSIPMLVDTSIGTSWQ
jgi:DNA polymerase-1